MKEIITTITPKAFGPFQADCGSGLGYSVYRMGQGYIMLQTRDSLPSCCFKDSRHMGTCFILFWHSFTWLTKLISLANPDHGAETFIFIIFQTLVNRKAGMKDVCCCPLASQWLQQPTDSQKPLWLWNTTRLSPFLREALLSPSAIT